MRRLPIDPAIAADRAAAAAFAERHGVVARRLVGQGRLSAEEADELAAILRSVASGIRAGLHVMGEA